MKLKPALNQPHLFGMLFNLTILFVLAQIIFFAIHYKVSNLVDSLISHSIIDQLFYLNILLPIGVFIIIQCLAYGLFILFIWFLAQSLGALFDLSNRKKYGLGLLLWMLGATDIFVLNGYYYPDSFFSQWMYQTQWSKTVYFDVIFISFLLIAATFFAYFNFFSSFPKAADFRTRSIGKLFLFLGLCAAAGALYDKVIFLHPLSFHPNTQPNIIFIGLDSLRPDFISYYQKEAPATPNIDRFMQKTTSFTDIYTPLARTFPTWVSILTAKYPKHTQTRNNLANSDPILHHETLAQRLQQAGYETMYATDEKRFSNVTRAFGFDRIVGPEMGVNDFLLGGLSDFPLTNLLIKLPLSRVLFPYNYANRAASITYDPAQFLHLIRLNLFQRQPKPLFLNVHFCITHWPFGWAHAGQPKKDSLASQYRMSIQALDDQFGELMGILEETGLLKKSLIVLLSDHGTTLGLEGDRLLDPTNYQGQLDRLKLITINRKSSAPAKSLDFKQDYTIATSYGQGTDVLSLKQYRTLLAFRGYGVTIHTQSISERHSIIDITPTILDFLNLPGMWSADGVSLLPLFAKNTHEALKPKPIFIETGDSIEEIETDKIEVDKVLKHRLGAYRIRSNDGLIFLNPTAEKSLIKNKQRAVLLGDWLLAKYPEQKRLRLTPTKNGLMEMEPYVIEPYYVLMNLKTKKWTIGLSSAFAKTAPATALLNTLTEFYGEEL